MSALENETTRETTTFEHFDREWSVPTKINLAHRVQMRDEGRRGWASYELILAEALLGAEQFAELVAIAPDDEAMSEFADLVAKAVGFGGRGNSATS